MLRWVSEKASHTLVRPVNAWNRRHSHSVKSNTAESTYVIVLNEVILAVQVRSRCRLTLSFSQGAGHTLRRAVERLDLQLGRRVLQRRTRKRLLEVFRVG